MSGKAWFKPKTIGYGATPTTWQGWVVTIAFVLIVLGALGVVRSVVKDEAAAVGVYLAAVTVITAAFVLFVRRKTDGPWKWRP